MLARCAHCQQDFTTERYGVQTCPHCGWEILLPEPGATVEQPPGAAPPAPPDRTLGTPDRTLGAPPPPAAEPTSAPPGATGPGAAPPAPPYPGAPWGAPPAWPPAQGWTPPPSAARPEEGESSPFAQRGQLGLFAAFSQTWRLVAFEASHFFRRVKTSETGPALLFGVVSFTVGTWVSLLFGWMAGRAGTTAMQRLLERIPMRNVDPHAVAGLVERTALGGVLTQAILTPLLGVISIYLVAAVAHVMLLAVRGAPRGFATTLTTIAYAYGLFLLEALPMCGGIVAIFWFLVVAITGLGESQRCGGGKAAFALLGPAVIACFCLCACGGWAVFTARLPGTFDLGRSGEGTGL